MLNINNLNVELEEENKKILTIVHQVIKNLRSNGIKSENDIPMTKEEWKKLNERNCSDDNSKV